MKKKVTSTDIAKAAGVSQATVSMVLNKKYNVSFSKETIQKVEQAAQERGNIGCTCSCCQQCLVGCKYQCNVGFDTFCVQNFNCL